MMRQLKTVFIYWSSAFLLEEYTSSYILLYLCVAEAAVVDERVWHNGTLQSTRYERSDSAARLEAPEQVIFVAGGCLNIGDSWRKVHNLVSHRINRSCFMT